MRLRYSQIYKLIYRFHRQSGTREFVTKNFDQIFLPSADVVVGLTKNRSQPVIKLITILVKTLIIEPGLTIDLYFPRIIKNFIFRFFFELFRKFIRKLD